MGEDGEEKRFLDSGRLLNGLSGQEDANHNLEIDRYSTFNYSKIERMRNKLPKGKPMFRQFKGTFSIDIQVR